MIVELLQYSQASIVQQAYGICTGKDTIDLENIPKWVALGHESPLEHWVATFRISGISRSCSHQLVRHRMASYSQLSMRYVDMSNRNVVAPRTVIQNAAAGEVFAGVLRAAFSAYNRLRGLGIPKEDARYVLPIATGTDIIVTMNARSLRNFFKLRLDPAAQWEIRELASQMLRLVQPLFPQAFEEFRGNYS